MENKEILELRGEMEAILKSGDYDPAMMEGLKRDYEANKDNKEWLSDKVNAILSGSWGK